MGGVEEEVLLTATGWWYDEGGRDKEMDSGVWVGWRKRFC